MLARAAFTGKTVLITGHTGFKGSWLAAWLHHLGADVVGASLDLPSQPCHFAAAHLADVISDHRIDIRDNAALETLICRAAPDFLFHLAAQPLVRPSYVDPIATYQTNVMGTLHVLEALRQLDKGCVAVLITSDKCYDNVEWVWGYRETDTLGGPDPYSASKGAAELVIRSHVKSFFPTSTSKVRIGVARAGNVIGGGDWAADRIVPDCVRAWSNDEPVQLRNAAATRPWQHVLEPLSGYLTLAIGLHSKPELHGEPFNFGPAANRNHTVLELVQEMSRHWERVRWQQSPSNGKPYEAALLKLNCDKALQLLQWHAVLDFEDTVRLTADWYRSYYVEPDSIASVTRRQLSEYETQAVKQGLLWAR
jgi:CDP-glucose 4,6-dehydratase